MALKGKKQSSEHIAKRAKALTGKKQSKEHTEKNRQARLKYYKNGGKHGMKGKKHTEEANEKNKQAHLGKKMPPKTEEWRIMMSKRFKGEKSHLWKGGTSEKNDIIRHSIEIRLWREAVFARDAWTCQKCLVTGGRLNAHHILNFAKYEELRFAIDNGITLCRKCHIEFHSEFGIKNNTKEQINEFLIS